MNKHKLLQPKKLVMDFGRFFLLAVIPWYRIKRHYASAAARLQIRNLNGALIAANHQSFADPMILNTCFWKRRMFYVAAKDIMTGARGFFMRISGCIGVSRGAADAGGIKKCIDVLKDGYLLGIFPVGHIDRAAVYAGAPEIKGGAVLMAAAGGVPIVPMYIKLRKHWWERVNVALGEPILIKDFCQKSLPSVKETEAISAELGRRLVSCRELIN